jgi:coenzyme PQQ biosynthesis protein PqqD
MLLYPERGLALSDTAAAILKLCDGAHSVESIVDALARDHPASDMVTVRADVETFLEEMARRGLLRLG